MNTVEVGTHLLNADLFRCVIVEVYPNRHTVQAHLGKAQICLGSIYTADSRELAAEVAESVADGAASFGIPVVSVGRSWFRSDIIADVCRRSEEDGTVLVVVTLDDGDAFSFPCASAEEADGVFSKIQETFEAQREPKLRKKKLKLV